MSRHLIDAHCQSVTLADLSEEQFAAHCTESSLVAPAGVASLDSPFGPAIRRWRAPVLDLEPLAPIDEGTRDEHDR